jgi:predicted transcriptional regulator
MPTTTIRLPEALKERIAAAAKRSGQSVHSYLLHVIATQTSQDEARAEFYDEADKRYSKLLSTGNSIDWHDMRCYLRERAQGKTATSPAARKGR